MRLDFWPFLSNSLAAPHYLSRPFLTNTVHSTTPWPGTLVFPFEWRKEESGHRSNEEQHTASVSSAGSQQGKTTSSMTANSTHMSCWDTVVWFKVKGTVGSPCRFPCISQSPCRFPCISGRKRRFQAICLVSAFLYTRHVFPSFVYFSLVALQRTPF